MGTHVYACGAEFTAFNRRSLHEWAGDFYQWAVLVVGHARYSYTSCAWDFDLSGSTRVMTVLEALATLESAVLECKKRNVNTPEVKHALDSLESYVWPKWLIPQSRHHALE